MVKAEDGVKGIRRSGHQDTREVNFELVDKTCFEKQSQSTPFG
jgi:hypothetical protein